MAVSTGKREWRQLDQVRSKTCSLDCGRTGFKLRQQGPIPKMTLTQVGSQKVINFNHWGNDYRQVYFIHFKIKLKCSGCSVLVTQSCQTLCDPMDCSLPGSSVHGDSPGQNTEVGSCSCLQGNLPNPGIKPRSPTLQADSLLSEPPVDYHKWLFNMLRYAPSILTLVRVLIMNGC